MLSRSLGWFSLGLGLTEIAAPHVLARAIGIDPRGATGPTLRAMGVRECLTGLGVLLQPRRPRSLWARIAGDAVDLALLGLAAGTRRTSTPRLIGAIAAVAGVTALDVIAARRTQQAYDEANRPVIASVTINKPPQQVYEFYRRLSQLPLFMDYLESVRELDQGRSHWVAKLPLGKVEWKAEITEDRPGELLAWRSVEGSKLKTSGRVTFTRTPGRDMTEVRVEMRLGFLGTKPSTALASAFARPQIKGDLRRLKQVLETGEVLYSDASLHRRPYPAQPTPAEEVPQLLRSAMPFIESPPTALKGVTP
jgi:uncharacterized membrane protein